jgi:L-alanine-DL-glutamate epimerase-like enolase superfamily enzyme
VTDRENPYRRIVTEMNGGVGWRDLSGDATPGTDRRPADRDAMITGIETVLVEANFPWTLVVVHTDAGVYGLGEAFLGPANEAVRFLEPALVGENPLDVERLAEHATQLLSGVGGSVGNAQAAVAGIETALWDAAGRLLGLPVYQLLGGKFRDEVRLYADCHAGADLSAAAEAEAGVGVGDGAEGGDGDGGIYEPAAYARAAEAALADGFDALKFDLDAPEPAADTATRRLSGDAVERAVETVAAVRDAVGDATLAVDLHWNFSVESAVRVARALEGHGLAWIEDPVPPESVDAHRRVTEATSVPILTGENLTRTEGFLPFLAAGALDLAAPDPQKCGGLAEFRRIATLADAHAVPVAPHNVSSPVGTVANVHACASVPNATLLEYHSREVDWWESMHAGEPLIADGRIAVPEGPGLGIDLDWDVVADHLAPGASLPDVPDA